MHVLIVVYYVRTSAAFDDDMLKAQNSGCADALQG